MEIAMIPACHVPPRKKSLWGDKVLWTVAFFAALAGLSYPFKILEPFRVSLFMYFKQIGGMLLLGFIIGGVIDRFVPREVISVVLARKKKRSILYAVLLGFLMSTCSHGVLALAVQLHKKGASTPVVVSFLLTGPWANLPMAVILFGFFGLKALYIIFGAMAVAVTTGLLFQLFEARGWIESNPNGGTVPDENYSLWKDVRSRFRGYSFSIPGLFTDLRLILRGSVDLAKMVLGWVLIGMGISALAGVFVPSSFFQRFMGPSTVGLFATLGLATVMEICSEGTAPMAFEIFKQTGAFGNAFVFLMAGVATNYTEIALVWANMGRKTALWLPVITVPQVTLLGLIANGFFR